MTEKERQYLNACFGGDYQGNKHKKEYAHIDLASSAQSGIEAARQRQRAEKERNVNKILFESVVDLRKRGVINERQMNNMLGVVR